MTATRIKLRRDTSANWTANNPILQVAEVGIVTDSASDSVKVKIGDGTSTWNTLAYFSPGVSSVLWGDLAGTLSDQTDLQNALDAKADESDLTNHTSNTSNPHSVTKSQVGLSNVDNTSDALKPVSSAQSSADAAVLSSAQSYADSLVVGLWDDRGTFNASVNAYPSSGGSGTAGAIKKGDIWTVSVAGTLPTAQVVEPGDTVRALLDGATNAQADWAILQNNIGYVPVASVAGTSNRITSTGGANPIIDISGSYVGQSSINTVGTLGSGVWNATPINDAYLSNKEVGTIYLEDFSAGSIAANYTVNGAGTFVVSGGSMAIGNGNGAYARYAILKNFLMASDRFELIAKYTVGDLNTAGIAFGIQSATRSFIVQLDTTTSASSVLKIQNGADNISGVLADFNTTMAVASGDKIEMYVEYTDNIIRVLCYNKTTPATLKWEYRVIEGESSISITEFTVGNVAVYSVGGNHTLTSFEQKDKNTYNPDYLWVGDSITKGYISKDAEFAYINRLRQEGLSIAKLACHSALASDYGVSAFINYINKINPKRIINFVGTNDVNTISAAQATINYDALVVLEKAAGYTVIHTTAMDRTGITSAINTFNASMKSTYTTDVIVDMNAAIGTSTSSALIDGTHPYVEGHKVIADTYKKYLNVRTQFLPRNYSDRSAKLFILNGSRLASAATFGTTDTQITTSGTAAFSDFSFNGYVNILKLTTMTSEIAYFSGRDTTKVNGLRRGLFGTTALSIASSTDSNIAVIFELKTRKDTVSTPYYQELVGANTDAGFIWNRTAWMATTDLYHFHMPTASSTTFRISSISDALIRFTRNATTDVSEFMFETYTAGSLDPNYRLRLGTDGIFIFTAGASSSNYVWSADSTRNFGVGTNTTIYRNTNGGANVTSQIFLDPARSVTAGFGYGLSTTDGFVFTQANGTRRIVGAIIKPVSISATAASEAMDLAIYTQTGGAAAAEIARFTGTGLLGIGIAPTKGYIEIKAGTTTKAPLVFTSGTNNTTAQAGGMEYDGTNLFFTRSGTTRENVVCASSANTVSPTAPNRTITINVNGTTYYLAAKTTND